MDNERKGRIKRPQAGIESRKQRKSTEIREGESVDKIQKKL